MQIGYVRTSRLDDPGAPEAQQQVLEKAGCEVIYADQAGCAAPREQLNAALDCLGSGDVFTVTKMDRFARSMRDLMAIVDRIEERGAGLRVLELDLDTTTAAGKRKLKVLRAVADFEHSLRLERQREGIARAKAEGKFKGRARTAMAKAEEVEALLAAGCTPTEVARQLGIGRSSVYRAMQERQIKRQPAGHCAS